MARAELSKIITLRSTAITVGLAVVACLLVTGLVTHAALHQFPGWYQGFDPTQESLTGMVTVALAGGVFGAMLMTGEYSSGTIRTTLAAAPRRAALRHQTGRHHRADHRFLRGAQLSAFYLGQAVLSSGGAPTATLASSGAFRAVTMTGLVIALLALMSFGFGLIFRSTAAAIAAFVGVVFVLPLVIHGISEAAVRYLPTNILTQSVMSTVNQGQGGPFLRSPRRRIVANGPVCRFRRGRRSRAVREARRLSDPGAEVGWVQIRIPEERVEQARRLAQVVLREPFQKRSWAELGYFLAASALATGAVCGTRCLGFAGLVLTIVFVGIFILGGGLRVARGLGRWQRTLAWATLGEEIAEPEPFSPPPGSSGGCKLPSATVRRGGRSSTSRPRSR